MMGHQSQEGMMPKRGIAVIAGARHEAALLMHSSRWPDVKISEVLQVCVATVRRWRMENGLDHVSRFGSKINDAEALKMYEAGASDAQIAERFGATQSGATRWRQRKHLPPNFDGGTRLTPEQQRKARKLLRQGLTRAQVGFELGVTKETIQRIRNQMKPHPGLRGTGKTLQKVRAEATKDPQLLYARIVKAVGKGVAPDIAADAVSDLYMDLLEGKLQPSEIETAARKYKGRVLDRYASRFGPRSLDEEIGEDGFSLAEMVEDRSALDAFDAVLERTFMAA
jgi:transcriptional regulator with XRE-family HTH domain